MSNSGAKAEQVLYTSSHSSDQIPTKLILGDGNNIYILTVNLSRSLELSFANKGILLSLFFRCQVNRKMQ